ncbi:hypothetical protein [Actinophytocola sediminis]
MALNNIHVEQTAMSSAVGKSSDTQTAIMDYERQLSGIADMVKAVWGGRAKTAFDAKHQEIAASLGINSQDAGRISEGTNQALNISLTADDDAYAIINAINGQH